MSVGGTERCSWNWLCLSGNGYRGGCWGGMEWGAIFGKKKFQGPGRKDTTCFWESHTIGAS